MDGAETTLIQEWRLAAARTYVSVPRRILANFTFNMCSISSELCNQFALVFLLMYVSLSKRFIGYSDPDELGLASVPESIMVYCVHSSRHSSASPLVSCDKLETNYVYSRDQLFAL